MPTNPEANKIKKSKGERHSIRNHRGQYASRSSIIGPSEKSSPRLYRQTAIQSVILPKNEPEDKAKEKAILRGVIFQEV